MVKKNFELDRENERKKNERKKEREKEREKKREKERKRENKRERKKKERECLPLLSMVLVNGLRTLVANEEQFHLCPWN